MFVAGIAVFLAIASFEEGKDTLGFVFLAGAAFYLLFCLAVEWVEKQPKEKVKVIYHHPQENTIHYHYEERKPIESSNTYRYPHYIQRIIDDPNVPVAEITEAIDVWLDPFAKSGNGLLDHYLATLPPVTTEDYVRTYK